MTDKYSPPQTMAITQSSSSRNTVLLSRKQTTDYDFWSPPLCPLVPLVRVPRDILVKEMKTRHV